MTGLRIYDENNKGLAHWRCSRCVSTVGLGGNDKEFIGGAAWGARIEDTRLMRRGNETLAHPPTEPNGDLSRIRSIELVMDEFLSRSILYDLLSHDEIFS